MFSNSNQEDAFILNKYLNHSLNTSFLWVWKLQKYDQKVVLGIDHMGNEVRTQGCDKHL